MKMSQFYQIPTDDIWNEGFIKMTYFVMDCVSFLVSELYL